MSKSILSKENCLNHYQWGGNCHGWNFIQQPEVSIKQELMPKQTAEKLHYHQHAQQFFFILKGSAKFLVEGEEFIVTSEQGFHIEPGKKHKITNNTSSDLEFILFSYPSTQNDRIDCE